jgi:hypothetical protein
MYNIMTIDVCKQKNSKILKTGNYSAVRAGGGVAKTGGTGAVWGFSRFRFTLYIKDYIV